MPAPPPALRHPDFRRLWTSILCSGIALQMAQVAIGWQVYSIRHNAFDLGLIGLAEFAPVPLLALPAGQHQYAFVVDGARWVVDPGAPAVDDGFGRRNSDDFVAWRWDRKHRRMKLIPEPKEH